MKTSDLIFKELLLRGYSLEGKNRIWNIADSKLWYLNSSQAQSFLELEKNKGYKKEIIDKEVLLINRYLPLFLKELSLKSYNLIDLGCGDGRKALLFIKKFSKHLRLRYCPVDISAYMVNEAARTIREQKIGKVLKMKWNISDFENLDNVTPLFRDSEYKNHFMMLLGNTLGNFDRDDILHGIRKSMAKSDVLLIGNGLNTDEKEKIAKPYRDTLVDTFLIKVIEQIGLSKKDVRYNVRFKNSRIEMLYVVKKDKTVKHFNKKIDFIEGDIILTAISNKYTKHKFTENIKKFFSNVKIFTDTEGSYALALCKR